MPHGRYCWCWDFTKDLAVNVLIIILIAATAGFWILGTVFATKDYIKESRDIRQNLLSKVTANSPISGFYGPGTWWAWLITLGMAHGLGLMTGHLPPNWDHDLVGASAYAVAAAIDLIHKSRQIAQLGDQASESVLIPALVCAECVIAIGAGSSLISVILSVIAALIVRSTSGLRTAAIAIIPLILALVTSGFTLRAHCAIAQTAPVFWWDGHRNDTKSGVMESTATIHFPANLGPLWSWGYLSYGYRWGVGITLAVTAVAFVYSLAKRRGLRGTLWFTARAGLIPTAIFWTLHIIWPLFFTGVFTFTLLSLSIVFWWPVYILAYFPQLQFFPVSGTSIFEMDQIAALLAVVVVTLIRIARPIFKSVRSVRAAAESDSPSSREHVPLLAESNNS
ncbi:hypothetical protein C8J57DRAFT_1274683, partial [Mycena rebaudengoi]